MIKKIIKNKYFWLNLIGLIGIIDILVDNLPDRNDYLFIWCGSLIFINIVMYAAFNLFSKK